MPSRLAHLAIGLIVSVAVLASNPPRGRTQATPIFTNPRQITNAYLPLSKLRQDVLEGSEGGHKVKVYRTALTATKTLIAEGTKIEVMVLEDKELTDSVVTEITRDYFAQSDDGAVYYLGEEVDNYKKGKVVAHSGAWVLGKGGAKPGVIVPGKPLVGRRFQSESVPGVTTESDVIVSVSATAVTPSGTYRNCVKVKEMSSDGDVEYKYYATGVGVVREQGKDVDLKLVSHSAKP